jgi:hypothetical protein
LGTGVVVIAVVDRQNTGRLYSLVVARHDHGILAVQRKVGVYGAAINTKSPL